ncbi:MAG: hypothetical protein KDJ18_00550 [Hyphomicrobiaceae bacterium]|nr:hypothetical protein [Hyphomicrobiaceae bacterium]
MYDKLLALFSFALFAVFLAILGIWVESVSLKIVLVITTLMCAYDFWLDTFSAKKRNGDGGH